MDMNAKFYNAAWHLVFASRLLSGYEDEMARDLLEKAGELHKKIEIDETQIEEIEEYEEKLREIL